MTSLLLFTLLILILLAIDLFSHGKDHVIKPKEALKWSFFWISLALLFAVWIAYSRGTDDALTYLAAYVVEKSLSVDNLFIFILIFRYFGIGAEKQHTLLFWGVVGALIMRAIFIAGGLALINNFSWIIYVFALFLIYTGFKLLKEEEKEFDADKNIVIRLAKKIGIRSHWILALIAVETTDVIFALDSIPAVLAISQDAFIVYTSNIFAILGLRSLYFALSGLMSSFHRLHYGLAAILIFIGIKMLLAHWIHIPITISLGIIAALLTASILWSILDKPQAPVK
jgi:tellurite resistance protein TerC